MKLSLTITITNEIRINRLFNITEPDTFTDSVSSWLEMGNTLAERVDEMHDYDQECLGNLFNSILDLHADYTHPVMSPVLSLQSLHAATNLVLNHWSENTNTRITEKRKANILECAKVAINLAVEARRNHEYA